MSSILTIETKPKFESKFWSKKLKKPKIIKKKKRRFQIEPQWIDCAELPLPSTFTSKIIKLNSNHLLAITTTGSIYIYNIIDNQWKTPYGDNHILKQRIKSVAVDYINNKIYLFTIKNKTGIIFTFEYNILIKTNIVPDVKTIKCSDFFSSASTSISAIFANNQLHLLQTDADKKTSHYLFDIKSSKLTKIFQFKETKQFKPTLIHKSNNTLMLFGATENTYTYSFHSGQWTQHYNEDGIRSLLQAGYQDCHLTPNEKHLIVFGGYGLYNGIHLVSINDGNLIVEKSMMSGPITLPCKAMLMDHGAIDNILVIGYYRKCWIDMDVPILSNDIVKLICAIAQRDTFIHYFPIYKRMNYKLKLEFAM